MRRYAGVDLGASHLRTAVADGDGTILAQDKRDTPQGPRGDDVTEAVLDSLKNVCADVGIDPQQITAAGIGSIGPLDLEKGTVVSPANLPEDVEIVQLRDPVANLIESDMVSLHNDTIAGVIGERYYADIDIDQMVYLTISSGIGAGVVVDGSVLHGWDGNAGEIGHTLVDPDRRRACGCGQAGHWEAYCSGNNIPDYARQLRDSEEIDTSLDIESESFTAEEIFNNPADPLAAEVIERTADWNAIGVTNLVHSYAPRVVAIGGAVALNNPTFVIDPIRERIQDLVITNIPEIRPTLQGDDVVLYGAIASAITSGSDTI